MLRHYKSITHTATRTHSIYVDLLTPPPLNFCAVSFYGILRLVFLFLFLPPPSWSHASTHTHMHTHAVKTQAHPQTDREAARERKRDTSDQRGGDGECYKRLKEKKKEKAGKFCIYPSSLQKTAEPSAITGRLDHESLSAVVCWVMLQRCAALQSPGG